MSIGAKIYAIIHGDYSSELLGVNLRPHLGRYHSWEEGGGGAHPRQFFANARYNFYVISDFCAVYFSTCLNKVWQVSITFGYWARSLFSMSCHGPVNANAPCYEYFHLIFDIHDTSNYPWRFKSIWQWIKCKLSTVTPTTGHMASSHMRSSHVTKTFTSITPHKIKKQAEPWVICHCVYLVKTHRLIAILPSWVVHQIRSFDLTCGQTLKNGAFAVKMHMFRCVSTRGIQWCFAFFSIFVISKVIGKNIDLTKKEHFLYDLSGKVKIWHEVVKSVKSGMVRLRTSQVSVRPCCGAVKQVGGKRAGVSPPPKVLSRMAK